jgi:hypothetical protein
MYFIGIFQSFKTLIFEIPAHKVGGREGGGPSPHQILRTLTLLYSGLKNSPVRGEFVYFHFTLTLFLILIYRVVPLHSGK